jgi:hypothetical protein
MEFSEIRFFRDKEDFSLERNDLICITNKEYINKNVLVLFYKKSDKKETKISTIFSKVGNMMKSVNLNFVMCAVDNILGLEKAFHNIMSDRDHPYNWVKNRPKVEENESKFPFILLYRKGFPQSFYEGNLDEKSFMEFCMNITVKLENTGNILSSSKEIKKQQWMEYRKKDKEEPRGKAVYDALLKIDDYTLKLDDSK